MIQHRWNISVELNDYKEEQFYAQLRGVPSDQIPYFDDDRYPTTLASKNGMTFFHALHLYLSLSKRGIYSLLFKTEKDLDRKTKLIYSATIVCTLALILVVLYFTVFATVNNYNNAMRLLSEGKYDKAITAFSNLNGYKDSKDRIRQAEADKLFDTGDYIGAEDIYATLDPKYNKHEQEYEKTYNHGESLRNEGKYEEAVEYFQRIGVYKDSPTKIIQARADKLFSEGKLSEAYELYKTLDSKYNEHSKEYETLFREAEALVKQGLYEDALEIYQSLGSYNDSESKYYATVNLLIRKSEEERNYAKAKEYYLLIGKEEEAAQAGKEQEAEEKYQEAKSFMLEGKYMDAAAIFVEINKYEDSSTLEKECRYLYAEELSEKGDFLAAEDVFRKLGDYKDSKSRVSEMIYLRANENVNNGYYDKATELFESLGTYKDSESKLVEVQHLMASVYEQEGKLEEAIVSYQSLGEEEKAKQLKYELAENKYKNEDIQSAIAIFSGLDSYNNADKRKDEVKQEYLYNHWRDLLFAVGNTIIYGEFEQDDNNKNGREPLEWIVLDRKDDSILVTTKYAIVRIGYENARKATSWDKSKVRTWLNNSFLDLAFSKSERDGILETEIRYTKINNSNNEVSVFTCKDKVFLLSYGEVQNYFATDEARKLNSTLYAKNHGAHYPQCYWMTRSTGNKNDEIWAIKNGGQLGYSTSVDDKHLGVRPAMWLDLDSDNVKMASVSKGNVVTFGHYGDKNQNTYAPLSWRIIESTANSITLLAENVIDNLQFNKDRVKITWEKSDIRKWLNSSFVDETFDNNEKTWLLPMIVRLDSDNGVDGYRQIESTVVSDKVTLMSFKQASTVFTQKEDRRAIVTEHAKRNGAGNEFSEYWLLSPGKDDVSMAIINWNGDPDTRWVDNRKGVRPMVTVSLFFGLESENSFYESYLK